MQNKPFKLFGKKRTEFVTRLKDNAAYEVIEAMQICENSHSGVEIDEIIEVQVTDTKQKYNLKLRKMQFYDRVLKRRFEFLTNLFDMRTDMILAIYKLRWQIELLFKQLKQNFPLKYFLADNENAIKILIYCA